VIAALVVGLVVAVITRVVLHWWYPPARRDEYVTAAWRDEHLRGRRGE
jgi:hypothetical protein